MTDFPAIASRTFPARVIRVQTTSRVEALLDLDFGVHVRHSFAIVDAAKLSPSDAELRDRARHCLVVLLGQKRVLLRPDPRYRERWHQMSEIPARVYLCERVRGNAIGYIEAGPEFARPVLEVGPYLTWLADQNFDIELVKETLNGAR